MWWARPTRHLKGRSRSVSRFQLRGMRKDSLQRRTAGLPFWAMSVIVISSMTGCAVRYFDHTSGIEHVWGFGHLRTRVTPVREGVHAVIVGSRTVGLRVGVGRDDRSMALGWSEAERITVADDDAVELEWPRGNRFGLSVGAPINSLYLKTVNQPLLSIPIRQKEAP